MSSLLLGLGILAAIVGICFVIVWLSGPGVEWPVDLPDGD